MLSIGTPTEAVNFPWGYFALGGNCCTSGAYGHGSLALAYLASTQLGGKWRPPLCCYPTPFGGMSTARSCLPRVGGRRAVATEAATGAIWAVLVRDLPEEGAKRFVRNCVLTRTVIGTLLASSFCREKRKFQVECVPFWKPERKSRLELI